MDLQTVVKLLIGAALVLLLLVVATTTLTRRSMLRKGALPDDLANQVRAELIEGIKDASTERGTRVSIAPFWQGTGFTAAQRYYILEPLLARNLLRPADSQDSFERAVQQVWRNVFNRPVGRVILNERDWLKMAQGVPGIVVNGGMHGGTIQQGSNNKAVDARRGSDMDKVLALVKALRADATAQDRVSDSEEMESLADSLESDVRKDRWSQVQKTIERVADFTMTGGKIMEATQKALSLFT